MARHLGRKDELHLGLRILVDDRFHDDILAGWVGHWLSEHSVVFQT